MSTILEINNLYLGFNNSQSYIPAIRGIKVTLKKGEKVGVIGESGSGKSQTFLSTLGLLENNPGVTAGEIIFDQVNILENIPKYKKANSGIPEKANKKWIRSYTNRAKRLRGKNISIIFQDAKSSLIPYKKIIDQAWDTWKKHNIANNYEFQNTATSLLADMGINDNGKILDSYPNQLSGGEAQRAYIMLALLGNPEVLIADEPTSSLDPYSSRKIIDLLVKIVDQKGLSLIFISHRLDQILSSVNKIYVFLNGLVIEELEVSDINDISPLHPYTIFLFKMANGNYFRKLRNDICASSIEHIERNNYGCPYSNVCELKKDLDNDLQSKCNDTLPKQRLIAPGQKVACWAYEK